MREIKFRIWDKELKRYDSPNVHHLLKNDGIVSIVLNMDVQKISGNDRFIIQQFTGLKDKNGVEIYEGDILKIQGFRGEVHHVQVKWESVDASNDMGTDMIGFPQHSQYGEPEVVGNIFENPELFDY